MGVLKIKKVIKSKSLESTDYRYLFECIKKKGIESVFNMFQDIKKLPSQEELIRQIIMGRPNEIALFCERNKGIIDYLQEKKISLSTINFNDENVFKTLCYLVKNQELIDLYLENARKLEYLQVEKISFVEDLNCLPKKAYRSYCRITPLYNAPISLEKYYTDGRVIPVIKEEEKEKYNSLEPYCRLSFSIDNDSNPTFVLKTIKEGNFESHREIDIIDFGFDGSRLPTNEEVESYDVPKSLILANNQKI